MNQNFEKEYKVKYYDCKNNYITFAELIKYTQETSTLHTAIVGCDTEYLNKNKIGWILLENHCKAYKYPKQGEKIIVKTWVNEMQSIYAFRHYEIIDEKGEVILQSYTKWVLYSFERMRPIKIPDDITNMYIYTDKKSVYIEDVNFEVNDKYDKTIKDIVLYKDVDTNWHMNNVSYIKAVSETMGNVFLDNNEIEQCVLKYKHQLIYNKYFDICVKEVGDLEYIYNVKEEKEELQKTKRKNDSNTEIYIKWRRKSESDN